MENSERKKSIRRGIVLFSICFLTVFLVKGFNRGMDMVWKEEYSVYDIQNEVQWGVFTMLPYGLALKFGLTDSSLLLHPLISFNDRLYQNGISKIPEDDTERFRLWFRYKYWQYRWSSPKKYIPDMLPQLLKNFQIIAEGKAKSHYFDELYSKLIMLYIINDFFKYAEISKLTNEEKINGYNLISKWLLKNCADLDMKNYSSVRDKEVNIIPLVCQTWAIKYMEYNYMNGLLCDDISLQKIDTYYEKFRKTAEVFYLPDYNKNSKVTKMITHIQDNYQKNRGEIINSPKRCKD